MKGNCITKRIVSVVMTFVLLLTGIWVSPQEVSAEEHGADEKIIVNNVHVGDIMNTGTQLGTSSNMDITYKIVTWMGSTYVVNFSVSSAGNYYHIGYDYQAGNWNLITKDYNKWKVESFDTGSTPFQLVLAPYIFKVTYQFNGSTVDTVEVTPNTTTKATDKVSVEAGYTVKWYKESSYKTEWNFAEDIVTSDMTLYGRKEVANSTATFVDTLTNGTASNMPQEQTIAVGGTVTEPSSTPSRAGYTFKGWYADKDCNTKFDFTKTYAAGNSIKIYAGWTANTYKVTFDAKGGNCDVTEKTCTYAETYGDLPTPGRTGYTFEGWYIDETFSKQVTSATDVTTGSNHTLYAKWKAHNYKIQFDANGGSGSMNEQSLSYDETKNLSANSFSKADHKFDGWNTKADGTGTSYTNGQEVKNLSAVDGDVITLYAQWGEKTAITAENLKQNLKFSLSAKAYDGDAQEVSVTAQPGLNLGTITVKYYDKNGKEIPQSELKNAGTYTVKVDIAEGADNKEVSNLTIGTFTIEKRKVTITAADKKSVYGEAIVSLTASVTSDTGLVNANDLGTIGAKCDVTSTSAAGTYKIVPTYTANANYDVTVVNGTYTVTKKAQQAPSGFQSEGVSYYNGTKDTADGMISGVTDEMEYRREGETSYTSVPRGATSISDLPAGVYYIRYKEKNNEQASADVTVRVTKTTEDTTAPVVTIKQGENKINKVLSKITFGLFFKDTTKFEISATDEEAGVDESKYAYYLDENPGAAPKSGQEIANLSWTTGSEISVNPEKRFVLYVKAEDKVGNVSYTYTDGLHVVKSDDYVCVKDVEELQKAIEQGFDKIKIEADIVIPENTVVTIPESGKIVISKDVTVENNGTVNGNGTIYNNGTLINNQTITGDVTIINNGKLVNNGTIDTTGFVANSSDATESGSGSNTANSAKTITYSDDTKSQSVSENTVIQFGNGTISMEIKSLDKSGTTTGNLVKGLAVSQVEKIVAGCLTDEERAAVEKGQNVRVKVTVKMLESSASADEKSAMEETLETLQKDGYTANMADYLDITFEKKVGTSDWTKITNLSNGVDITMNIPTKYQKEGRVFYIVRNHNGKCEILSDNDKDAKTVTFTTDRFSTYALGYVEAASNHTGDGDNNDTGNNTNNNNTDNNSGNTTTTDTTTNTSATTNTDTATKAVQTGDNTMPAVWFAMLLAGSGMIFFSRKRERK